MEGRKHKQPRQSIEIIGCASGVAGADSHCDQGPPILRQSAHLNKMIQQGLPLKWKVMLTLNPEAGLTVEERVAQLCTALAKEVAKKIKSKQPFLIVGGDHSCAIGTWSGVANTLKHVGDIGLIWIDAHMDSHTPATSLTQHIHGMPLAVLLGYGFKSLTQILDDTKKLKPENICLLGVRSFEAGEAALLNRLKVKVYFMDEVREKGFSAVLNEAISHVSRHTIGYGVTLDLDSIDPYDAPGVDVPEHDGIRAEDVLVGLKMIAKDPRLITTEIVEFDPIHDHNQITEKLLAALIKVLAMGMMKKSGSPHVKLRN